MKRRRIAPKLLISALGACCAAVAFVTPGVADATLAEDHNLRVRSDMEHELHFLVNREFAPLEPSDDTLRRLLHHGRLAMSPTTRDCIASPLTTWTTQQIREMGYDTYKTLFDNKVIQMAYVYKHYIDKSDQSTEYFVDDAQTAELFRRHRDTIAFWSAADIDDSISVDSVLLLSMHGSVLKGNDNMVPIIMRIFDFDDMADVLAFADKVRGLIEGLPGSYDNPLLTMNAIATRSTRGHGTYNGHDDPTRRIRDSIIIGDGVLRFLADSGLGASGPDFVHAHEFGHHIQFQMDTAVPPMSAYADDDRRKELMADAISGYFLAHDQGGDMMPEEILLFDQTAYATGDCSVTNKDHHGTPRQRQCAAIWGASQASPDDKPLLDPEVFVSKFNDAYLGMLDLDASVCTLVVEETSLDHGSSQDDEGPEEWDDYSAPNEGGNEEPVSVEDWLSSVEHQNNQWKKDYPEEEGVWDKKGGHFDNWSLPNLGRRPNDPDGSNREGPAAELGDRGSPSEMKDSHVKQSSGWTVQDCSMPWVFCYTSSANYSVAGAYGWLYMASAIAVASSILFST